MEEFVLCHSDPADLPPLKTFKYKRYRCSGREEMLWHIGEERYWAVSRKIHKIATIDLFTYRLKQLITFYLLTTEFSLVFDIILKYFFWKAVHVRMFEETGNYFSIERLKVEKAWLRKTTDIFTNFHSIHKLCTVNHFLNTTWANYKLKRIMCNLNINYLYSK